MLMNSKSLVSKYFIKLILYLNTLNINPPLNNILSSYCVSVFKITGYNIYESHRQE